MQTPIVYFIYNRPDCTFQSFATIRRAKPDCLYIVADGAKKGEEEVVAATRKLVDEIDWPCKVEKKFSDIHLGCKKRIVSGMDWIFKEKQEEKAIFIEDDVVASDSFFRFCEELLIRYANQKEISSISGCNFGYSFKEPVSYFFCRFMNMWGWATWRRAYETFDFEMRKWPTVRKGFNLNFLIGFDFRWARYLRKRFDLIFNDQLDSWDYQVIFSMILNKQLGVFPRTNLVRNIGFDFRATHTKDARPECADLVTSDILFPLEHNSNLENNQEYENFLKQAWADL